MHGTQAHNATENVYANRQQMDPIIPEVTFSLALLSCNNSSIHRNAERISVSPVEAITNFPSISTGLLVYFAVTICVFLLHHDDEEGFSYFADFVYVYDALLCRC